MQQLIVAYVKTKIAPAPVNGLVAIAVGPTREIEIGLHAVKGMFAEVDAVRNIEPDEHRAHLLQNFLLPKLRPAVSEYNAVSGQRLSANRVLLNSFGSHGGYAWNPNNDAVTVGITA